MDFTYTEEQKMLKSAAHRFLAGACPNVEWYLEMDKDEKGFTPALWNGMAELGWMGILFPEEYGGIGGNMLDMVTLMEEMGYAALPGPYFSTVILGGCTILAAGSEEQKLEFLPKIAEGKLFMTLALTEPATTQYNPSLIAVKAKAKDNDYVIDGTKLFVPDANVSDWMVVATAPPARTQTATASRCSSWIPDPWHRHDAPQTVAGDKQCEVVFKKVSASHLLGEPGNGLAGVRRPCIAAVAKCAEILGRLNKVMELAVAYAKVREQFGKAIGTFQAVQHLCANMKMATEQSIYITYKAAWMIDQGMPEARKFAAVAKTWVSKAYKKVALIGHQIFGGTGLHRRARHAHLFETGQGRRIRLRKPQLPAGNRGPGAGPVRRDAGGQDGGVSYGADGSQQARPIRRQDEIVEAVLRKKARDYDFNCHGCSQAVVQFFLDVLEEDNAPLFMAASPFAAGMSMTGHNCGALIGGLTSSWAPCSGAGAWTRAWKGSSRASGPPGGW